MLLGHILPQRPVVLSSRGSAQRCLENADNHLATTAAAGFSHENSVEDNWDSAARIWSGSTKQLQRGAVTGVKVKEGSLPGADIKLHSLTGESIKPGSLTPEDLPHFGLGNLQGTSGTAINNTAIELKEGACGRYVFAAAGVEPGEALILQGSDNLELQHAIEAGPSISNPNQINVSVCTDVEHPVSQTPGTVQLRFDTIG